MNLIAIDKELSESEVYTLKKEFSKFDFIFAKNLETQIPSFDEDTLQSIRILFTHKFTWEMGEFLPQLRWVHTSLPPFTPAPNTGAPQPDIISCGFELDASSLAELIWAGVSYYWKGVGHLLKEGSFPEHILTAKKPVFLQVGLGELGTELCKLAKRFSLKTWGIQETGSFHSACTKAFSSQSLHALLPHCDILSIGPFGREFHSENFDEQAFKLIHDNTIIILAGVPSTLFFQKLAFSNVEWARFRGIIFYSPTPIEDEIAQKMRALENVMIIPHDIHTKITQQGRENFVHFRNNLRFFTRENYPSMQGVFYRKSNR